jgi:alkylhydroperoxidase family enzyme
MNGCAYCLHMHTQEAVQAGEQQSRLHLLNAWHESAMDLVHRLTDCFDYTPLSG